MFSLRIATLLLCGVASSVSASPLTDHFVRLELQRLDDRPTTAALVLDQDSDAAWVDFVASSARLHGSWYAYPSDDIELILNPRNAKLAYVVEQRLVTYLNVTLESESVTIDLDASTAWLPLEQTSPGHYLMNAMSVPEVDLTPAQLVEVVRRQAPEAVAAAKQCVSLTTSPCQLVTDHELRIFLQGEQRQLVGAIRLYER